MPGQKIRKKQASTPKADVSFSAHVTCGTVANCAAATILLHCRPSLPLLDAKQSKHVLQYGNLSGISRQRRSRTLAPGLVDATPAVLLHLDMHGGIHSHRKSGRSGGLRSFLQGSSRRRRVRLKHERTLQFPEYYNLCASLIRFDKYCTQLSVLLKFVQLGALVTWGMQVGFTSKEALLDCMLCRSSLLPTCRQHGFTLSSIVFAITTPLSASICRR